MLMITPDPCFVIGVRAARLARRPVKKFIRNAHSKSSSVRARNPSIRSFTAPMLLTSTSTRPYSSMARCTSRPGPSGSERSTSTAVTLSSPSRLEVLRDPATTFAPSSASAWVAAMPMPLLAPVTTATLSFNMRSMGLSSGARAGPTAQIGSTRSSRSVILRSPSSGLGTGTGSSGSTLRRRRFGPDPDLGEP